MFSLMVFVGTDIFIATWNIHRSPEFWENPDVYDPERFLRSYTNPNQPFWNGHKPSISLYPNEQLSDYAFLPFGGGARKCVGDQFAMMEAVATVSMILLKYDLEFAIPPEEVGMKTGNSLFLRV